jgi:CHAT domain-containing protein
LQALRPSESSPRTDIASVAPIPASSRGIDILFQRARLLVWKEDRVVSDQERALSDLNVAADMLDRLRDSASGPARTQEVDLTRHGEGASDLWPVAIGLLAGLEEWDHGPGRPEAALAMAERGASRAFLRSFGRAHAELAGRISPEALAELAGADARLATLDQQIEKTQSVPVEKRDPKAVGALLDERRQAEAAREEVIARVERDFPQYAALRYPRPCSLEQARATLGENEVALHFVAGSEASFLVVLEKAPRAYPSGIGVHCLPADGELAERVAALVQDKVLMDAEAARERGSGLYQTLLEPAARAIEGRDLVVVAGGPVGELPFEVLVEPDGRGGRRWLVQGHRVRYAPSLTALHFVGLWDAARPPADRPLWALGDPTYTADDPRLAKGPKQDEAASIALAQASRSTRGEALTRLAASGAEVERIAGLYKAGASDRLVGAEATEATVKRLSRSGELAHYRLIHFACHGVLGSADGLPPGLVLAQGGDQEGEDGYLRLDEVANLKLDADLVVLSACQTALGKRGRVEGVSSLGRAFLYAGCRSVVGSLWKVDDAATADLMAAFHARLKAGQPPGEALRATQLQAIADDQPPYFWAPFILLGRY